MLQLISWDLTSLIGKEQSLQISDHYVEPKYNKELITNSKDYFNTQEKTTHKVFKYLLNLLFVL